MGEQVTRRERHSAEPGTAVKPLRVGVIGCGHISSIYLENAGRFAGIEMVAVADLDGERARVRANEHGVRAATVDELLGDPAIDAILNLTVPGAHAAVSGAALEAGKHVYSEKPLATERTAGRRLLELATERGLTVGCAPDTFLGGGLQTARKALDDGLIGTPVAATAFMMSGGVESWHPNPEFFYQPGAGPLFDMGPYYLSALVNFFGPIARVSGSAATPFRERVITTRARAGERIPVTTPTHISAHLEFESGAVATLITSFDAKASRLPRIEVYGSEGTLGVPDPNTFGGPVLLGLPGGKEWQELPIGHGFTSNSRGVGLADMAHAISSGTGPRASGELAFHVLDAMQAILESAQAGRRIGLESRCARPEPLPLHLPPGLLEP